VFCDSVMYVDRIIVARAASGSWRPARSHGSKDGCTGRLADELSSSRSCSLSVGHVRGESRRCYNRIARGGGAALAVGLLLHHRRPPRFRCSVQSRSLEDAAADQDRYEFRSADVTWPLKYARVEAPPNNGDQSSLTAAGAWLPLFRNAAPYIAAFRGGTVVLHIPSFILEDDCSDGFKGLMEDVTLCSLLGISVVVVSGIDLQVLKRLRAEAENEQPPQPTPTAPEGQGFPSFIVDEHALKVVKQEAGYARVEVESALSAGFEKRHVPSRGTATDDASSGIFPLRGAVSVVSSMNFFTAGPIGVRDGVDCRYSGIVRSVNVDLLRRRLDDGDIVSLTPLGGSPSGEAFFVSSEALAARVATSLKAMKLVYITEGQRVVDTRVKRVIPGMQVRDARSFLSHLQGPGQASYSDIELSSIWFTDFIRLLKLMVRAVSSNGVGRAHLVEPSPGALLQEFFTTDGSGTVVAQDVYQGLGQASIGDMDQIFNLLQADARERGLPSPSRDDVETGCQKGQFFVWKRDEVVLGCAQLLPVVPAGRAAELRYFCMTEEVFLTHARAFFAYGERAAIEGGAKLLWVQASGEEQGRLEWFSERGFVQPKEQEQQALPTQKQAMSMLVMRLGEAAAEAAAFDIDFFKEEQRMWGGVE